MFAIFPFLFFLATRGPGATLTDRPKPPVPCSLHPAGTNPCCCLTGAGSSVSVLKCLLPMICFYQGKGETCLVSRHFELYSCLEGRGLGIKSG